MTTLSPDRLKALVRVAKREKERQKKFDFFDGLIDHFISLNGPMGAGKTASGVMLAHTLREMTGRPVIIVGTLMHMTEAFGECQFVSSEDFVCQMRGVSEVSPTITPDMSEDDIELDMWNYRGCPNPAHNPEYVQLANLQWRHEDNCSEKALENAIQRGEPCWTSGNGIVLYRSIILLDEGNEFVGGDTASNPLTRLFQRFVQIMRHLGVTLLVMCPFREDIAPKPRRQVWTFGQCAAYKELGYIKISFSDGVSRMKTAFRYNPREYFGMYVSKNILSLRATTLNIAQRHL